MSNISSIQQISQEYYNFKNSYIHAGDSLQSVIAEGTVLYNDPTLASLFPNSYSAYQQYLVNLQTAINTFIAALPVEPPLNG